MSFIDEKQMVVSPVDLYLDWKGKDEDGFFSYYDKEAAENVKYKIGKCAIINIWFCVKGFNEGLNTSIYSNKIWAWDEEVIVKSKWDILARWMWKEIRDEVSWFWGSIHKVITMFDTSNWKIIEMYLKWQAGWGIIDKETKKNIWWGFTAIEKALKNIMNIADSKYPTLIFNEAKLIKGKAFSYNVPEFKLTEEFLNKEETETYLENIKTFNEYRADLKANTGNKVENTEEKSNKPVSESFATDDDAKEVFWKEETKDDFDEIPF